MTSILASGWWLCVVAFGTSVILTMAAMTYANRRGMLDTPGYRRSHTLPTPRGGGIGIVVGTLIAGMGALSVLPGGHPLATVVAMGVAGLAVALVGWVDDHRDISALLRLLVQLAASALFTAAWIGAHHLAWFWFPVCVLLAAWSINLHNFMDGIDGILGMQIVFVGAGIGLLALFASQTALAVASFGMAAAACGFLLFNWPPARVFMGDVGSGFAGFMIFAWVAVLIVQAPFASWSALILVSAFVVDAGLTLAWRMWRGKRWYTAHREHLYQWLVRCRWTHARASGAYLCWNLLLVAPVAAWAACHPRWAPWACLVLYLVSMIAWWRMRHVCMALARRKRGRKIA